MFVLKFTEDHREVFAFYDGQLLMLQSCNVVSMIEFLKHTGWRGFIFFKT